MICEFLCSLCTFTVFSINDTFLLITQLIDVHYLSLEKFKKIQNEASPSEDTMFTRFKFFLKGRIHLCLTLTSGPITLGKPFTESHHQISSKPRFSKAVSCILYGSVFFSHLHIGKGGSALFTRYSSLLIFATYQMYSSRIKEITTFTRP